MVKRISPHPSVNASTGVDTDGTLLLNRVWLSAKVIF